MIDQVRGICDECDKKLEPDEEEAESSAGYEDHQLTREIEEAESDQPLSVSGFRKAGDLQSDESQLEDLTFDVSEHGDDEIIELAE